jgi:hypothetical protein
VLVVAALDGWFDSPQQKVASATRKCGTSMQQNRMQEAEGYCKSAIAMLGTDNAIPVAVIARANTQMAALAVTQKRYTEAVQYCQTAIAAWRDVNKERFDTERFENIQACESVISAVNAAKQK